MPVAAPEVGVAIAEMESPVNAGPAFVHNVDLHDLYARVVGKPRRDNGLLHVRRESRRRNGKGRRIIRNGDLPPRRIVQGIADQGVVFRHVLALDEINGAHIQIRVDIRRVNLQASSNRRRTPARRHARREREKARRGVDLGFRPQRPSPARSVSGGGVRIRAADAQRVATGTRAPPAQSLTEGAESVLEPRLAELLEFPILQAKHALRNHRMIVAAGVPPHAAVDPLERRGTHVAGGGRDGIRIDPARLTVRNNIVLIRPVRARDRQPADDDVGPRALDRTREDVIATEVKEQFR